MATTSNPTPAPRVGPRPQWLRNDDPSFPSTSIKKDEFADMMKEAASIAEHRHERGSSVLQIDPKTGAVTGGVTKADIVFGSDGSSVDDRMAKFGLETMPMSERRKSMIEITQEDATGDFTRIDVEWDKFCKSKGHEDDFDEWQPSSGEWNQFIAICQSVANINSVTVNRWGRESHIDVAPSESVVRSRRSSIESRRGSMIPGKKKVHEDETPGHIGQSGDNGTEGGYPLPDTTSDVSNGEPTTVKEGAEKECPQCGMVKEPAPDGKCPNCGASYDKKEDEGTKESLLNKRVAAVMGTRPVFGKVVKESKTHYTVKLDVPVINKGKKVESIEVLKEDAAPVGSAEGMPLDKDEKDQSGSTTTEAKECPKCHKEVPDGADKCPECGAEVTNEELDPEHADNSMGAGTLPQDDEPGTQNAGTASGPAESVVKDAVKRIAAGESAQKLAKSILDSNNF